MTTSAETRAAQMDAIIAARSPASARTVRTVGDLGPEASLRMTTTPDPAIVEKATIALEPHGYDSGEVALVLFPALSGAGLLVVEQADAADLVAVPIDDDDGACFYCLAYVNSGDSHNDSCSWVRVRRALGVGE